MLDGAMPGAGAGTLVLFLVVGVLGGAHCLGMCGPLVTLYGDRMEGHAVRQHLLFNLGRTAGYAAVGALLGGVGSLVFDAADLAAVATPVRATTGIVAGSFIVVTGGGYLLRGHTAGHGLPGASGLFGRVTAALTGHVDRLATGPGVVALGGVHAFLPCPILYPAYLFALATGSATTGALALGAVGVGTIPTLLGYAVAFDAFAPENRARLHRVLGVVFLVVGYVPLSMGLRLAGVELPMPGLPVYQPLG